MVLLLNTFDHKAGTDVIYKLGYGSKGRAVFKDVLAELILFKIPLNLKGRKMQD